ncbi:hypothetical protein PISL3812_01693 [Talaromyces islandicus]|uniref:Uncharacterized protein n=1 Tax=Talaromyces islandicus TaxID=28573 RepID=A0A0U1LMT2_TALIS|nr:hypothetical protein PISL3812_01693 [Talaromyces islandicus]
MQTPWQPSLDMDWTMQQYPAYQFLALANETPSRVYKRRASSRVTKPSSAGNSPHSLPRRRTMNGNGYSWAAKPEPAHPVTVMNSMNNMNMNNMNNNARKSRPTSWHPSSRHAAAAAAAAFNPYAQQNCHPSWLNPDAVSMGTLNQQDLLGSALSTPITCPVSGDLISNDSFAVLDNYYGASTMAQPQPQTQAYTPVEPADMTYSGWSSMAFLDQLWTHPCSGGYLPAADQVADFCQESVSSSDPSTAPATPDGTALSHPVYKNDDQSILPEAAAARGDDLVALGLYDEPQVLSLGSSLLGGSLDSIPHAGKGLKLEETFSPAPVAEEDDDDADHEED